MSTWMITQKPSFYGDFSELSKVQQQAVTKAISELEQRPITPHGNTIRKLTGFENVYRYRLGDFRLVYAAEEKAHVVQLLAIGPRGSIYERFNYDGWDGPDTAVEFGPELATAPEWQNHPEWFAAQEAELPRELTPDLLIRWRIDPRYHAILQECRTEDGLFKLGEVGIPDKVVERVMERLYPSSAARLAAQPDYLVLDPADLIRRAEGDLAGFLLRLDEQQQPLTSWALAGPTLVKGGPGSGKSTVALYRVRAIVNNFVEHGRALPSILFTTYTNALINVSESLLRSLLRDPLNLGAGDSLQPTVHVSTLHRVARSIVLRSGDERHIADGRQRIEALHAARAALQPRGLGDAAKISLALATQNLRDDYLLDEFHWVLEGQNCQSLDDYLAADRTGRGLPFNSARRTAVWALYETYRQSLADQGLHTWGQLILVALEQVRSGAYSHRWDHVVVDEAQDLPPAALALAVQLARDPAGVFLTADANQSVYNRGFRWRGVHNALQVTGRTRILRRNYRSTRQIAAAAAEIMQPGAEVDTEAIDQEFIHAGPAPQIYAAASNEDQWQWIGHRIYQSARELRLPLNAAAVLVNASYVGEPLAAALQDQGLHATFMNSKDFDLNAPGIKVTTLHAAKGLEFPIIVIAHVEAGRLPRDKGAADPDELTAHEAEQRRLFFVGSTRAMRHLFVTHDRSLPSPFLADLSPARWERASLQ